MLNPGAPGAAVTNDVGGRLFVNDHAQAPTWAIPMPNPTHPDGVPLDVWLFTHHGLPTGAAPRRRMAARLIDTYSSPGGVVVNLDPGRGEVLAATTDAGQNVVVWASTSMCDGRRRPAMLDALAGGAQLVLVPPPACRLAPPRPHALSPLPVERLCRRSAPLLRPGGFPVLGVVGGRCARTRDPLGEAVHAGAPAGLAEAGVVELRERVARLEGAAAHPLAGG